MKDIASKYLEIMESGTTKSDHQTSEWDRVDATLNLADFFVEGVSCPGPVSEDSIY